MDDFIVKIKNSEIEGENKILEINLLRLSKSRVSLTIFLSIITFGIYYILISSSNFLKKKSIFKNSNIKNTTHVFIRNSNESTSINKINRNEHSEITFINQLLKYKYNKSILSFQSIDFLPEKISHEVI